MTRFPIIQSLKGEKVLNVAEYAHHVDNEEQASGLSTIQYQIAGNNLHPSMVSADGTPYAAYTQAQINQVNSQVRKGDSMSLLKLFWFEIEPILLL